MDNVTHALAGLLLADAAVAVVQRRVGRAFSSTIEASLVARYRRAAVLLGVTAAEFPDADLLYSGPLVAMGKLGYLLHHRGHTHTIVWAVISAVLLWLAARWWWQRGLSGRERADATSAIVAREGSKVLLLLALAGTLSHLLLDFTNSYGVHPFWPFDNRWYYGDSIFIVEPWLMVVAIPPLLFGPRRAVGRVLLSLVLVAIVSASWFLGEVARPVAWLIAAVAASGLLVHALMRRVISGVVRVSSGIASWVLVTALFASASLQARAQIRAVVADGSLRDVVLTPGAADPRCFSALVVTASGAEYRVSTATVASFPRWRSATACNGARGGANGRSSLGALSTGAPAFANSGGVAWGATWSTPVAEFSRLAATRCDFAAALRFMRTPAWAAGSGGALQMYDVRFGAGGGFAEVDIAPVAASCVLAGKWIPPWTPPTSDILRRP